MLIEQGCRASPKKGHSAAVDQSGVSFLGQTDAAASLYVSVSFSGSASAFSSASSNWSLPSPVSEE